MTPQTAHISSCETATFSSLIRSDAKDNNFLGSFLFFSKRSLPKSYAIWQIVPEIVAGLNQPTEQPSNLSKSNTNNHCFEHGVKYLTFANRFKI